MTQHTEANIESSAGAQVTVGPGHVEIRGKLGDVCATTVLLDGREIPRLRRYTLTHEAGPNLPVLTLELYPGSVTIEHPEAVVHTETRDLSRELADAETELWVRGGTPTLAALAAADAGLAGIDVPHLAEDFASLTDEQRAEIGAAMKYPGDAAIDIFVYVMATGRVGEFAQAVSAARTANRLASPPQSESLPTDSEGAE